MLYRWKCAGRRRKTAAASGKYGDLVGNTTGRYGVHVGYGGDGSIHAQEEARGSEGVDAGVVGEEEERNDELSAGVAFKLHRAALVSLCAAGAAALQAASELGRAGRRGRYVG